jgi:hypothetical protein
MNILDIVCTIGPVAELLWTVRSLSDIARLVIHEQRSGQ